LPDHRYFGDTWIEEEAREFFIGFDRRSPFDGSHGLHQFLPIHRKN
jgi:hypothetical protein